MKTKRQVKKDLDGWIEVFIIDPITYPLVPYVSKFISKNPLFYTFLSFFSGLLASVLVLLEYPGLAAFSYFFAIILDGLDGKVARYNNNKILIHGVVDVITDIIKNSLLILAIGIIYPNYLLYLLIFMLTLFVYEATYSMRLHLRSKYFKDEISMEGHSMTTLKEAYEGQIKNSKSGFLSVGLIAYNFLFRYTRPLRTYPYPTVVDAEFVLLVLFLVFQNVVFIYVAVLFLIPDMLISFLLTLMLALRASEKTT